MNRKNPYYELNFSCMLYGILLQYFVPLVLIIVEITVFIQIDKLKETLIHFSIALHMVT